MMKGFIAGVALLAATGAWAQAAAPGAACPAGTRYGTIRHSLIKPGKLAVFEKAVAAHNAWYVDKKNATRTRLMRLVDKRALMESEAATITLYADTPMPERDAAFEAFTALYRDSSTLKDEMRGCLPAL
ncbi:hypothetical protein NX02_08015 [Sphingomonas sanxanigenens DSM 19645 = NX02]|uniref:Uncharacterized protein n=2 Tax=Sphingomonas sanxanigenens TaxID=397260 RepID=W0AA12_9SPHN|nr:hypothetical protein NX02_08015 [Sphingomonas sanxanigenens DSM 19645 = NX02]